VNSCKSLKRDFEEIEITKDDERRLKELSKNPNINDILAKSIAPSIYGHSEVKRALALQLFGGTRGKTMKGGMPIRDDIHILLIGDPGIAKSRFLMSVSDIAPKSIYVSGKSVSGAGLTVAAEKDELGEGGWTLKAGALVLASGGTAQVDEFDKIEDEDRAALHEAMESQSISVAKAGIVAKFRTKTAILAAANPKYGRFDQTKNLADQFDVPPTLLSRFDLIFPIVDVLDEEKDAKLAEHILATHRGDAKDEPEVFDKDLLRKYIAYVRRKVSPKLTTASSQKIKEFYVELRRKGKDAGAVAITPRYLEGLVRLAEANAKMRMSDTVDEEDAEMAISLFNYVMMQIMTDKTTGTFDVDVVATGKPKSEREKLQKADTILDIIREHLRKNDTADVDQVISDAKSYDIDETTARRMIAELLRKGAIYEKEYGHIKIVGE
jgi:replicative DNA helicase Mcm